MNRWSAADFEGIRLFCIVVKTCHYIFLKTIDHRTPRVKPNVSCEHWVIMMCRCRFINCSKCTILVRVDGEGHYVCGGTCGMWEFLELFSDFAKTSPKKNKVY